VGRVEVEDTVRLLGVGGTVGTGPGTRQETRRCGGRGQLLLGAPVS
jgi:hypothetical protein